MKFSFKEILFFGFLLIALLPLLNIPPWFAPPAWGKVVVFRVLVAVLGTGAFWYAVKVLRVKTFALPNRSHPLFAPLLLLMGLIGVFFLSTVFSLDFYMSFWGIPPRSWGFVTFFCTSVFALLAFLLLSRRQWHTLWNVSFAVGAFIAALALLQHFDIKIIDNFVTDSRPAATLGNPLVLGSYLVLLASVAIGFCIEALRKSEKKYAAFYFVFLALYCITILVTFSRSAWIGLFAASLVFIFFYPGNTRKLKWVAMGFFSLAVAGVFAINLFSLPNALGGQAVFSQVWYRLNIDTILQDPRIEVWKSLAGAITEHPILGYGLYNSSVAFDEHYQSKFVSSTGWWDTAHNLVLDVGLWAGIPGVVVFFGFVGILLWRLQQVKRQLAEYAIHASAMQASLVGYVVSLFFAFDMFPVLLIFFLLVAYSLFLISRLTAENPMNVRRLSLPSFAISFPAVVVIMLAGAVFIYAYNLVPFLMNKEINIATYEASNGHCDGAIGKMDVLVGSSSFFAEYARMRYIDVIAQCIANASFERQVELSKKAIAVLEKSAELRPKSTRVWLLLGAYMNNLNTASKDVAEKEEFSKKAEMYFEHARLLSPRREELFIEWIRTFRLLGDASGALKKANECIQAEPATGTCWWERAVSNVQLKNYEDIRGDIEIAKSRKYFAAKTQMLQLINLYDELIRKQGKSEYYADIAEVYADLTVIDPKNIQYRASLAFVYRELGLYGEAQRQASKVFELDPAAKPAIEEFLKTLPEQYRDL